MVIETFQKDPAAVLDYVINWAPWLGVDTILTSTWPVPPPGVTLTAPSNTSTTTTTFVGGGTVGERYTITNRVVTAGGRTDERSIAIEIVER